MTAPSYLDSHALIVGAAGAGKTVTAKVLTERLLDEGRHTCIVDPTGAWHGLRTNAAGDGPGYAIPIFGGAKGDLPIKCSQGAAIGAIIGGGVTAILDLSEMDSDEQHEFMADFLAALRKKPRANFHLVVDEADEFAPQTSPSKAGEAAKRQMEWIAKRGRLQGFVLTTITQRPADIAKSVISQMQTLVAHQMIAPSDQKAVDDYLKANATTATRKEVMQSLAGLARGERWIYSPRLDVLERGVSPMPSTFDSSREPAPGESVHEPKMLAQIDLAAIRDQLAEEQAAPQEPGAAFDAGAAAGAALKQRDARIAELDAQVGDLIRKNAALYRECKEQAATIERMHGTLAHVKRALKNIPDEIPPSGGDIARPPRAEQSSSPRLEKPAPAAQSNSMVTAGETATELTGPQRQLLQALAWWASLGHNAPSRAQVAAICGWKITSGHIKNVVGSLRTLGMVDYPDPGHLALTAAGQAAAPEPDTGTDFHSQLRSTLTGPQTAVFDHLLQSGDQSRDELATALGWEPTSGHVKNVLGSMKTLTVVQYPKQGHVNLADWVRQ